jgi:peptidoglycan/xylan/chitin deacetylase (PgdA/CDA1 family)
LIFDTGFLLMCALPDRTFGPTVGTPIALRYLRTEAIRHDEGRGRRRRRRPIVGLRWRPSASSTRRTTSYARSVERAHLRAVYVRERSRAFAAAKRTLFFGIRRTGLPALALRTYARGRCGILVYHNPTPELLEQHLAWLAPRVPFVALDTLVDALHDGDWSGLPETSLVVTIDDGHAGNRALVDAFRRYGVRPTIFACSQIVGTRRRYWWTVDGIDKRLLQNVENERRLAILEDRFGFAQDADDGGRQALSREEIESMKRYVDFGSHTRFHPILPNCGDAECERELALSRSELAAITGGDVRHFAYPNGRYGEREVRLLRRLGYRSGRTIELGWNDRDADPYRLRILGVPDDASVDLLATRLCSMPGVRKLMFYR